MPEFSSSPIRLVCLALATFRLTHLLWAEAGPWEVFARVRRWAGQGAFFDTLMSCPLCLSVWVAGALVALYLLGLPLLTLVLDGLCLWLAVAAVSLLLFGWERGE